MLEKWELTHFPSDRDKNRYRLRLKIEEVNLTELISLIKADVGRPFVSNEDDFTWGIYVYDLDEHKKSELTIFLESKKAAAPEKEKIEIAKGMPIILEQQGGTPEVKLSEEPKEEERARGKKTHHEEVDATAPSGEEVDEEFWKLKLRPTYTFEEFIVGPNNRFIHAAALAVAENPGKVYNPLFIYGGVGLGKTHLMQAIGHYVSKKNPSAKILFITSEKFISEVIDSIGHGKIQEFRDRYRQIDILLVDDVQFFAESESTQEEFFHTFNILHQSGKQIILTSDRPPKQLVTLADRLRSRFEWGLIADIKQPSLETRVAILKRKGKLENLELEDSILLYVGSKLRSNIRELEGFLKRIRAYADITNQKVTIEMVKGLMNDLLPEGEGEPGVSLEMPQDAAEKPVPAPAPTPAPAPAPAPAPQPAPAPEIKTPPPPVKKPIHHPVEVIIPASQKPPSAEIDKSLPGVEVAFFYPEGKEQELSTIKEKFNNIIRKHNLKYRLESVFDRIYDPHSKINYGMFSELCKTNKIGISIFLGPPPDSLVTNEEFMNSLITLMDSENISLQYIAWTEFNKDYKYLNLALDIALTKNRKP